MEDLLSTSSLARWDVDPHLHTSSGHPPSDGSTACLLHQRVIESGSPAMQKEIQGMQGRRRPQKQQPHSPATDHGWEPDVSVSMSGMLIFTPRS